MGSSRSDEWTTDPAFFTKVDADFLCVPGSVQRPQTFDFRR